MASGSRSEPAAAVAGALVHVGRQPIFDVQLEVVAYELLFRGSERNEAVIDDGKKATAALVARTLMDFGLAAVAGQLPAYVNLGRDFIMSALPELLPPDRIAIEVLEEVSADPPTVARLRELSAMGFTIVLDDFDYAPALEPLLDLADVVKIDVLDRSEAEVRAALDPLRGRSFRLIAEKIETYEQLQACRRLGFSLFQGYFLCRPQVLKAREIRSTNVVNVIRLLSRANDPRIDLEELEAFVTRDVGLSYRLLTYINSAFIGLRNQVDSLHHAVVLLGREALRTWINLVALSAVTRKPSALVDIALIRGRMCENLGRHVAPEARHAYFTAGLLSTVDALLDRPLVALIPRLGLGPELTGALLERSGPLGEALDLVIAYERGDWDRVDAAPFEQALVRSSFLEALEWAARIRSGALDDDSPVDGRTE